MNKPSGRFCPHCLAPLTITASGFEFCSSHTLHCEYEVVPGAQAPLSKLGLLQASLRKETAILEMLMKQTRDTQAAIKDLQQQIQAVTAE